MWGLKRVTLHFYFSQVNIMLVESVQVSFEHVEKYFQMYSYILIYFVSTCIVYEVIIYHQA